MTSPPPAIMQASGMGGEIYDRDSAMKKYMAMSGAAKCRL